MKKLIIVAAVMLTALFNSCTYNPGTSRTWTSFVQSVDVETETEKKFKVVASVKIKSEDTHAHAGRLRSYVKNHFFTIELIFFIQFV